MGLLDKAKAKIESLSDEVVRVMETDDKEESKGPKKPKEKPVRKKREKTARKPRSKKEPKQKKEKEAPPVEEEVEVAPLRDFDPPIIEPEVSEDSAFDLDTTFETDFLQEKQEQFEAAQESYSKIDAPEVSGVGNIDDILSFLNISPGVEIPADVLMVEEIDELVLNHQAPVGYDFGEVDSFKEKVKESIKVYENLLKERNKDIAKIATAMDKLQVDLNNTKYDLQVANGLSIMPTNESAMLENDLVNEKIKNKELMKKIEELESSGRQPVTDEVNDFISALQDELALVKRENEELTNKNFETTKRLQYLEETLEVEQQEAVDNSYFNIDEQAATNEFMDAVLPPTDENEIPYEAQDGGFNSPDLNNAFIGQVDNFATFSQQENDNGGFYLEEVEDANNDFIDNTNDRFNMQEESNHFAFKADNENIDDLDTGSFSEDNVEFAFDDSSGFELPDNNDSFDNTGFELPNEENIENTFNAQDTSGYDSSNDVVDFLDGNVGFGGFSNEGSQPEPQNINNTNYSEEEDDDDLDTLMSEWNNN